MSVRFRPDEMRSRELGHAYAPAAKRMIPQSKFGVAGRDGVCEVAGFQRLPGQGCEGCASPGSPARSVSDDGGMSGEGWGW